MLAAWARLKYPHLIHASVASSAPVRAELEMQARAGALAYIHAYISEDEDDLGQPPCCATSWRPLLIL